ncbi:MAG: DUF559 domain-containing protein [Elusimicrobiota bacterium]
MRDTKRDAYIKSKGLKVIRYSDRDVFLNPEIILEDIIRVTRGEMKSSP